MAARARRVEAEAPRLIGYTGELVPVFTNASESLRRKVKFYDKNFRPAPTLPPRMEPDAAEEAALKLIPTELQTIVKNIVIDPLLNAGVKETMQRAADFSTPAAGMLAGIAADDEGRLAFEEDLDARWASGFGNLPRETQDEVLVGAGLHSAIYCAVRAQLGYPKPFVLEQNARVGGVFAVSRKPSFFLNSRNRPGQLSIPGEMGSLNFMPGAMVQPSELGGAEFQTNDALAWVIRSTLAMYAKVITNAQVTSVSRSTRGGNSVWRLVLADGREMYARRVVAAPGLGRPNLPTELTGPRILSFDQFMARMDDPYPLRGMDRVAVIGGGDGGKTIIEALCGQGPSRGYSSAALDWPKKIDWYGAPYVDCASWFQSSRSRYKRIGSLLPGANERVSPRVGVVKTTEISLGFNTVKVREQPYDYLVHAIGFDPDPDYNVFLRNRDNSSVEFAVVGGEKIGYYSTAVDNVANRSYVIGPGCNMKPSDAELEILKGISENATSIFRWAPKTAALASSLPA